VPHLLKLIRDNFVEHGFMVEGQEINKTIIENLFYLTPKSDLRISHKINMSNLTVNDPQRQKVKFGSKFFSHTVSQAMNKRGTLGFFLENENWSDCGKFFKQVRNTIIFCLT
jgi:hypothetical protein